MSYDPDVCDSCAYSLMSANSVNSMDYCSKREKFVWPLEFACEDFKRVKEKDYE